MRRAHPHLERAEGVLDRLAALAHGLRILVETPLHRLQYMLVLPAGDATLLARRAAVLDRAGAARIGPVAPQLLPVLLVHVVERQPLAGRAAIDIFLRQIGDPKCSRSLDHRVRPRLGLQRLALFTHALPIGLALATVTCGLLAR